MMVEMVRDPCNLYTKDRSHNPTLENNTRSPRVDRSLSLMMVGPPSGQIWVHYGDSAVAGVV